MLKSKHYSINLPWMYLPCITFQRYIIGTPPPSRNYILNDVQVLCWTQGCSWSATASELSGARWIGSHLDLFPQLSWYPWKKKRVMMKIQTRPSKLCKSRYNLPKIFWCYLAAGEDSLTPLITAWRVPLLGYCNPSLRTKNHICYLNSCNWAIPFTKKNH